MSDPTGLKAKLRKPVVLITSGALLVAGGVAVIVTASTRSTDTPDSLAHASRVLQSVSVKMSPDGDLTAVDGTVVGTTTDKKQFTSKASYSPDGSAKELPVRVLTAYRTKDKTGTDLSDLAGYDGPLEIQLTVQNLTTRPQQLKYDVDGVQRSRSALVGAPLTVVASAALDGLKPSAVRTHSGDSLSATNGVLSQDQSGDPQVQWATILAPPQLGSSTTMTLALDAKDFQVPDFDLSVEPGLITDPSMGALVDSVFNPKNSSQLRLEQRTIDLVNQVNMVLARAGKTIDRVRTTLDDSSRTLGTKTVSDLKTSASSIASSVKGLSSSVDSLGSDLTTTLKSTKSTTLGELQQIVQAVDQMLGETSAQAPQAKVTGTNCARSVAAPHKARSVYANLLEVVSQLRGYATASDSCKLTIQGELLDTVGPETPTAAACSSATNSLTCLLNASEDRFNKAAEDLQTAGNTALNDLSKLNLADALTQATTVSDKGGLVVDAAKLLESQLWHGTGLDFGPLQDQLDQTKTAISALTTAIDDIHTRAAAGHTAETSMGGLNADLVTKLCAMRTTAGENSPEGKDLTELLGYVSTVSCPDPGNGGATTPITPARPGGAMDAGITSQTQAWSDLATATDTSDTTQGTGAALAKTSTALDAVQSALDDLKDASTGHNKGVFGLFTNLQGTIDALKSVSASLESTVDVLSQTKDEAIETARTDLTAATTKAKSDNRADTATQIRQAWTSATTNNAELGKMFDRSQAGLSNAAAAITANGKVTISEQRKQFAGQQQQAGEHISKGIEAGLSEVAQGVGSSTRDMKAANILLSNDLRNVLLDLGTRQVKGTGLLGAMATGAATANSANYQLSLATDAASSYANVRRGDIAGLLLRQAQTDAALERQAQLPPFRIHLPASAEYRTVYHFHVQADE